jgi:alpha-amylase/alpha-mannosidase (GH57 family)
MYWANFLHIYQPPTQSEKILRKVAQESYRKIFDGLSRYPNGKLTLNINGCLTQLLARHGLDDILKSIRTLLERGQLEITDSAMYHAFLPLLPEREVVRQIRLNRETNQKYFGPAYRPRGFFPPEMAYTRKLGEILDKLGYDWIILDEAAYPQDSVNPAKTYQIEGLKLKAFFRERAQSFKILSAQLGTGSILLRDLGDRLKKNEYLLTAMDGETFGHHRLGLEQLLFDIYAAPDLPTVTVSELIKLFPETETTDPLPSSWALMHKDQTRKEPMSRWHSSNDIHLLQWSLTNLALEMIEEADHNSKDFADARAMLDSALHSDQYWWASAKPWWSLEMIERGANDLSRAVEAMPGIPQTSKDKSRELYLEIITTGFRWQREGIVEALVKEHYDEEVSERLDLSVPLASEEEFQKILSHLTSQMLAAAQSGEYERAAQFKRRIEELKTERQNISKTQTADKDSQTGSEWGK